jgi:hypothetical protein
MIVEGNKKLHKPEVVEAFKRWCDYRSGKKKPITTEYGVRRVVASMLKCDDIAEAVDYSIDRGWLDVFERKNGAQQVGGAVKSGKFDHMTRKNES